MDIARYRSNENLNLFSHPLSLSPGAALTISEIYLNISPAIMRLG